MSPVRGGDKRDDHLDVAIVVIAGGRSQRYPEGDKALVEVGGVPMCRRAVADLPGSELVVSCRADQRPALAEVLGGLAPRFAVDPVPDRGPLAGLSTALRVTAAERALVVACDMPFFDRATATELLAALEAGDTDAALVEADDAALPEPLGAAYHIDAARRACEQTLACGSRRLVDALGRLETTTVDARPRAVCNCNTAQEIERADDMLERRTLVQ
ncbi:MAG: molybdopterin-guanine dinucleotide biosynthesis protein A [Natronomonas sp.]|jgi:molybdopterin-guanine dinucleotide biosynthesis protein A|uniref:molybdenum cofactor guanylyltransferase n=1 Tax=Natronomonas sp. TaxID=2184060 RepID=UPI003989B510